MDETMGNQRLSYVYCSSDNEGNDYIGSRLCPIGVTPEDDKGYFGSYTYSGFSPTGKQIIAVHEDLKSSRGLETVLLLDLISDPKCRNKAVFPLTGRAKLYPTKDPVIRKKLSELRKSKPLSQKQIEHLNKVNSGQKKENHPRADKTKYPFLDLKSGELFYGTMFDLQRDRGVSLHHCHLAKNRFANSPRRQDCTFWSLAMCDLSLRRFSLDLEINIAHESGNLLSGRPFFLAEETGLFLSKILEIQRGKMRRGWKLNDYLERE